jgi:hypothetical protein
MGWSDRLLLIELKTDMKIIGSAQAGEQLRVARFNHPAEQIDHLFVTVRPAPDRPMLDARMRYRNVMWEQLVVPVVDALADDEGRRLRLFTTRVFG